MDSLYQRLKELDSDIFQRFCFHLLKEQHPGADIHHVEGASGDEGLDIFQGELSGSPTIWQCKAFPNGVGESQKSQIRESLKSALKNFKPKIWVLCLSVNLDSKASRWWERFKKSHSATVTIGNMFASDIIHELIHRRSLRNHFFPGAVLDPTELKRLITKTGELSPEELEHLTENSLEGYTERLKERDARFNYEIVYAGDLGPQLEQGNRPGLVMSFQKGAKRINVFARDVQALQKDPPTVNLLFSGEGAEKMKTLIKTGATQTFTSTEFEHVSTDLPLQEWDLSQRPQTLIISPSDSIRNRRTKTRLTFENEGNKIVYGLVELAPERAGTEEFELKTVSDFLPFELRFLLSWTNYSGKFTYTPHFAGADVLKLDKFMQAIRILQLGGRITVYDLEREANLFGVNVPSQDMNPEFEQRRQFISDLALVSKTLSVPISCPSSVADADLEELERLKAFCTSGSLDLGTMTLTLTKTKENMSIIQNLPQVAAFRTQNENLTAMLFGYPVIIGPCAMIVEKAEIEDYEITLSRFRATNIGEDVKLTLLPLVPVKFERLSATPQAHHPQSEISG